MALSVRALALADAEGLEAVTIRRLAADQGVTPMALYWHFRDKEVLLDAVVERVLEEVVLPLPARGELSHASSAERSGDWRGRLREVMTALLGTLRRHPGVVSLVPARLQGSASGLQISEEFFAALADAGFTREQSARIGTQALHLLVALVTSEPGRAPTGDTARGAAARASAEAARLTALHPDRYAHVIACAPTLQQAESHELTSTEGYPHLRHKADGEESAGWTSTGVDLVLGGIFAMREEATLQADPSADDGAMRR